MRYSLQSIRDRITLFSEAATSETATLVKEKILKYINQLKDMLIDCDTCKSPMSESCKDCIRVQEAIGWALEKLRKVEKK